MLRVILTSIYYHYSCIAHTRWERLQHQSQTGTRPVKEGKALRVERNLNIVSHLQWFTEYHTDDEDIESRTRVTLWQK